jgi:hypothetical protein
MGPCGEDKTGSSRQPRRSAVPGLLCALVEAGQHEADQELSLIGAGSNCARLAQSHGGLRITVDNRRSR